MFAAVALEPTADIAARLAAFRASYDPNFDPAMAGGWAHITVKRPAPLRCSLPRLVAQFSRLASSLALAGPVRVEIGGVSIYHSPPTFSAIFLRVVPHPALQQLHTELESGLAPCFTGQQAGWERRGRRYLPHLTLANNLCDRRLAQAVADLRLGKPEGLSYYQPGWISCPTLSLAVCASPNQLGWQSLASVSLV